MLSVYVAGATEGLYIAFNTFPDVQGGDSNGRPRYRMPTVMQLEPKGRENAIDADHPNY
jgi:hypothetical protein